MNLRHLEIVEAVAETGSFTGAAKKLFITQSAVSHAVAELEAQAGTALFDRLPKGVSITPCGRSLLEGSRGILIACRNLDRRMAHLEEDTPLHIVSSITIATSLLPAILERFCGTYPQLKVSARVVSADAVIDVLRHGDADIAFWEGPAPREGFSIIPLGSYRLKAACSPRLSLPRQPLSLPQLCRYPLLLRERGSAIRDTFDRLLAAESLAAEPTWESVNSLALVKAAEAGLGVAVLPENLLSEPVSAGRLQEIELRAAAMENQMFAMFHQNQYLTKPLQLLLDTVQNCLALDSPGL